MKFPEVLYAAVSKGHDCEILDVGCNGQLDEVTATTDLPTIVAQYRFERCLTVGLAIPSPGEQS